MWLGLTFNSHKWGWVWPSPNAHPFPVCSVFKRPSYSSLFPHFSALFLANLPDYPNCFETFHFYSGSFNSNLFGWNQGPLLLLLQPLFNFPRSILIFYPILLYVALNINVNLYFFLHNDLIHSALLPLEYIQYTIYSPSNFRTLKLCDDFFFPDTVYFELIFKHFPKGTCFFIFVLLLIHNFVSLCDIGRDSICAYNTPIWICGDWFNWK